MRLMILGGGFSQLSAIRRARERGLEVVVADKDLQAPGCSIADMTFPASTFDTEAVISAARDCRPDGILTLGTDQPVLTAALAADRLGLSFPLSPDTALAVTNKKVMKKLLAAHGIPVTDYRVLSAGYSGNDITGLTFPAVTKPLDSQGQRGVFLIESLDLLRPVIPKVLSYSREREIILESFYPSREITVNGWVTGRNLRILTVVDRVTRMFPPNIGVCTAHRYPSRYLPEYRDDIRNLSERIVTAAGIEEGPVYFQMLIGDEGIKVNEIACRLGGAYEDRYMPFETGVHTIDMLIDTALGIRSGKEVFSRCPYPAHRHLISVPLLFTHPGIVSRNGDLGDLLSIPGLLGGAYLLKQGTRVEDIENSTRRAVYAIIAGIRREEVNSGLDRLFDRVRILDENGRNMIMDTREDAYV